MPGSGPIERRLRAVPIQVNMPLVAGAQHRAERIFARLPVRLRSQSWLKVSYPDVSGPCDKRLALAVGGRYESLQLDIPEVVRSRDDGPGRMQCRPAAPSRSGAVPPGSARVLLPSACLDEGVQSFWHFCAR